MLKPNDRLSALRTLARTAALGLRTARRPYRPPTVVDFGELRQQTLGGSPGIGDSGNVLTEQPPGGPVPPLEPGGG